MLEITNDITLHSKTTHDIITCTSSSLYDKRRGQASKLSYIAYTLEGATSFTPVSSPSQHSAKAKKIGGGSTAHKSPIGSTNNQWDEPPTD